MLNTIFSTVTALVAHVQAIMPQWFTLFVSSTDTGAGTVHQVTALGLFCIVLPLVGLGIGVIRRLVKIRG